VEIKTDFAIHRRFALAEFTETVGRRCRKCTALKYRARGVERRLPGDWVNPTRLPTLIAALAAPAPSPARNVSGSDSFSTSQGVKKRQDEVESDHDADQGRPTHGWYSQQTGNDAESRKATESTAH
jgi:hypothetical protein